MKYALLIATCTALSLGAPLAHAAGDVAKGKAAFTVCEACHGKNAEGNKALGAPHLAGMPDWYLVRQLANFKSGLRGADPKDTFGTQMRPMAQTLADDAAVANVVAYIGSLTAPAPETTVKGDAAAGKTAYATCAACHGANGEGNQALNAPKLSGQHDWYLARQLQNSMLPQSERRWRFVSALALSRPMPGSRCMSAFGPKLRQSDSPATSVIDPKQTSGI